MPKGRLWTVAVLNLKAQGKFPFCQVREACFLPQYPKICCALCAFFLRGVFPKHRPTKKMGLLETHWKSGILLFKGRPQSLWSMEGVGPCGVPLAEVGQPNHVECREAESPGVPTQIPLATLDPIFLQHPRPVGSLWGLHESGLGVVLNGPWPSRSQKAWLSILTRTHPNGCVSEGGSQNVRFARFRFP